jgi:hypothetical protein
MVMAEPSPTQSLIASPSDPDPASAGGLDVTAGLVLPLAGAPGAFLRADAELNTVDRHQPSGFWGGIRFGQEGWISDGGGGYGLPFGLLAGARSWTVFAAIHGGASLFVVDYVGSVGIGLFTPRAGATFGVEMERVHIAADVSFEHRWQWGATSVDQLKIGLTFRVLDEATRW